MLPRKLLLLVIGSAISHPVLAYDRFKVGAGVSDFGFGFVSDKEQVEGEFKDVVFGWTRGDEKTFFDLSARASHDGTWDAGKYGKSRGVAGITDDGASRLEASFTFGKHLRNGTVGFAGYHSNFITFDANAGNYQKKLEGHVLFAGLSGSKEMLGGTYSLSVAAGLMVEKTTNSASFAQVLNEPSSEWSSPGYGGSFTTSCMYALGNNIGLVGELKLQKYTVRYDRGDRDLELGSAVIYITWTR
jgi:hypothetical protein